MKLIIIYIIYVFFVIKQERSVELKKNDIFTIRMFTCGPIFIPQKYRMRSLMQHNVLFLFTWNQHEKTLSLDKIA